MELFDRLTECKKTLFKPMTNSMLTKTVLMLNLIP